MSELKDGAIAARRSAENEMTRRANKQTRKLDRRREDVLNAVVQNNRPDVSDIDDLGVLEIEDPAESEELIRVGRGQPMRAKKQRPVKRARIVSLRDDPVGQMAKRGQLGHGDDATLRLRAARRWQSFYEQAEIGGARGIDPTRDIVDGGRYEMPDTDLRIRAQDELANIRRSLGANGDKLVTWVLGLKFNLAKVAAMLGVDTRMDQIVLGRRLRECLDTIADVSGMLPAKNSGPRRHRDRFAADAAAICGVESNPTLSAAVHRAKKLNEIAPSPKSA